MKNLKKILFTSLLFIGLTACSLSQTQVVGNNPNNKYVTDVSLDVTGEIVLEVGQSIDVTAIITYKDDNVVDVDMEWVSSKPRVASVKDGTVTALSGGSSIISFIAGYKSAYFTVNVYSDNNPDEGGNTDPSNPSITLNAYSRSLEVGDTYQLSVTLNNPTSLDETVSFASENSQIASVDDAGLVTAKSEGETNIIVSALGLTAKCLISVSQEMEEDEYDFTVYFFIDYNNIDEKDETGTKLLAKFGWFHNEPIANSGKVPNDPTTALDPAFPYFIGWSTHTIIDTKDDLCDLSTYVVENAHFLFIYGIWSDVPKGSFTL